MAAPIVTADVKEACEAAMAEQHKKTSNTPKFGVIAGELIEKHSWKHDRTMLRLKMSRWWDTSSGAGKLRKEKKRKCVAECPPSPPAALISGSPSGITHIECAVTQLALAVGERVTAIDADRIKWSDVLLEQFSTQLACTYDVKYTVVKNDSAGAQQSFRYDCMAVWKKYKPVMPTKVDIPVEARRFLRWWRQNKLETGEAGSEFINVCVTPTPKKVRAGITYKNKSQSSLYPVFSQSEGERGENFDGDITLPQDVARDAGPVCEIIVTSPPPILQEGGNVFWLARANGDAAACISAVGLTPERCEQLYEIYGHNPYVEGREVLWACLHVFKAGTLACTWQTEYPELGGRTTAKRVIHEAMEFLSATVNELDPEMRFNPFNHTPHFPPCVTCLCDVVPVGCVGGSFAKELFSGYYHRYVYKILVVTDLLGHILAWSGPCFGSIADITVYRAFAKHVMPLKDWEVMLADGSFQGHCNVVTPFRKPAKGQLSSHDATYNQVHQMHRARVEHMFARLWPFGLMKHIWQGDLATLTKYLRILLHFVNFDLKRGFMYRPLGPWNHDARGKRSSFCLIAHAILLFLIPLGDNTTRSFGEIDCVGVCQSILQFFVPAHPVARKLALDSEPSDPPKESRMLAIKLGKWLSDEHIRIYQEHTGHIYYDEPRSYAQLLSYLVMELLVPEMIEKGGRKRVHLGQPKDLGFTPRSSVRKGPTAKGESGNRQRRKRKWKSGKASRTYVEVG